MNLAAVCPVIALLGLPGEEALELLGKVKFIRSVYNGEKLNG
jgi:hypothetical protein